VCEALFFTFARFRSYVLVCSEGIAILAQLHSARLGSVWDVIVLRTRRPPMTQKPHCSQPGHDNNNNWLAYEVASSLSEADISYRSL
jgi:hypothetical protein